jgi:hypothetical protein
MRRHPIRNGVGLNAVAARPWAHGRERDARGQADALARLSDHALRDLGLERCALRHMAGMAGARWAGDEPHWPELPAEGPRGLPGDQTPQKRN